MFRFIWIKSFRTMVRALERKKREENMKKMQEAAIAEGSVDYLSGIDDGYYMACEDILKWIEKKEKKKKNS